MSSLRPTLRLARREILQHTWRSLLVTVLIGLPILASVAAVTLIETGNISDSERRPYNFGAAQARVDWGYVDDDGTGATPPPPLTRAQAASRLAGLVGSTIVAMGWQEGWLGFGTTGSRVDVLRTDFSSPLTKGIAAPLEGRLPTRPDEIAITTRLSHEGVAVGDTATVGGTTVHVVGVARAMNQGIIVNEGILLPTDSPARLPGDGETAADWSFLVGGPHDAPLTQTQKDALTAAGFGYLGRDLNFDGAGIGSSAQDGQLVALLVTCLLIEIVLLAGPAFAVGVRRQRHSLALLAVAGGSPRDVRRVVLAQGLLLGLSAAVLGAALSIPLTWLGLRLVFEWSGIDLGPFDIGWLAVVPSIALGALSALLACVVPARGAAKADVVTALSGRQPTPRVRGGWPVAGVIVLALGTLGSLSSVHGLVGRDLGNAWWAVVSVCGAVMMTPWLIAATARLAPRLALPLRLALRDADRHRSRSAPAIAAVMASVSAVVALGIGSGSDAAANDRSRVYDQPLGRVVLSSGSSATMDRLVSAIKEATGVTFTPLEQVENVDIAAAGSTSGASTVAVADAATLAAWGVTLSPGERTALAAGTALVTTGIPINDGLVDISLWDDDGNQTTPVGTPAIRAHLEMAGEVPGGPRPVVASIVLSPATADALHLPHDDGWITAVADKPAAVADSVAVRSVVAAVDPLGSDLSVSTRKHSSYWILLSLLSGLAIFTVLLGTFSATGLALDDAKHDLATLSAVGARPRTRRIVAGAHAFLIALVGAVLGVAVGFTPGIAAAYLLTDGTPGGWVFRVPWLLLLLLLVVLPVVAGVVTALVCRTRVLSLRRAA